MNNLKDFNPFTIHKEKSVKQQPKGLIKHTGLIENSAMAFDEIMKTKKKLKFCIRGYLKMFLQEKIKVLLNKF